MPRRLPDRSRQPALARWGAARGGIERQAGSCLDPGDLAYSRRAVHNPAVFGKSAFAAVIQILISLRGGRLLGMVVPVVLAIGLAGCNAEWLRSRERAAQ